jgi:hypothetical protein
MLCAWERQNIHTGFWLENLKGRPLGKYGHGWKYNIKIDLIEIRWGK